MFSAENQNRNTKYICRWISNDMKLRKRFLLRGEVEKFQGHVRAHWPGNLEPGTCATLLRVEMRIYNYNPWLSILRKTAS
jgi:hypothetical protein